MDGVPSVMVKHITTPSPIPLRFVATNQVAGQQAPRVLSEISNIVSSLLDAAAYR